MQPVGSVLPGTRPSWHRRRDGVELWLTGLGFVAQTAVVMPVVLALAYGIAILLDGALGNGIRLMRRARHQDEDPQ